MSSGSKVLFLPLQEAVGRATVRPSGDAWVSSRPHCSPPYRTEAHLATGILQVGVMDARDLWRLGGAATKVRKSRRGGGVG